jgi:hypothetical protein
VDDSNKNGRTGTVATLMYSTEVGLTVSYCNKVCFELLQRASDLVGLYGMS